MSVEYYRQFSDTIHLKIEEFEVFLLLDYEGLSLIEAAQLMDISRSSVVRIYKKVQFNLAKTIPEAKRLNIEGGKNIFNDD